MKKSLIALAVISATGSAFAQSSVSIYGLMDAGYNQVTTNTGATAESTTRASGGNTSGAWASNRLGFKGTEDLGNGNSANFMYELGLDAGRSGALDTGHGVGNPATSYSSATFATGTRSSWVSLKNNSMGELTVGRQYNPIFETSVSIDAGRANNVAFGRVIYGQVATTRSSGGIKYTSPNMNGLVVKAIMAQNEKETALPANTATSGSTSYGGKFEYALAGLTLVGGYHKTDVQTVPTDVSGDRTESIVGGTYNFGMFTLLAGMGDMKIKDGAGAQSYKRSGYQLGLQASTNGKYNTTGGVDLFATYGAADVQTTSSSTENQTKGYQAGAIYNLSPRSGVYAVYGKTTGTLTNFAVAKTPGVFEGKGNEFAVGVRHLF